MKPFIDSDIKIGQRILRQRKLWGYTQEQIAEELHVTGNYIGSIERGQRSLSLPIAEQLCLLFGTTLDYWYLGLQRPDHLAESDTDRDNPTARTALFNLIAESSKEECEGYLEVLKAVRGMMWKK